MVVMNMSGYRGDEQLPILLNIRYHDGIAFLKPVQDRHPAEAGIAMTRCSNYLESWYEKQMFWDGIRSIIADS